MTRSIFCGVVVLALAAAAAPAGAGDRAKTSAKKDCETRMQELEASTAEGADRLAVKYEVLEHCGRQYGRDKTIDRLVKECAKYAEQPIVKQQFLAECQLAAYNYANALRALKAEYRR
jgi:hypothetical protein